jgi:hypothetical protein
MPVFGNPACELELDSIRRSAARVRGSAATTPDMKLGTIHHKTACPSWNQRSNLKGRSSKFILKKSRFIRHDSMNETNGCPMTPSIPLINAMRIVVLFLSMVII